MYIIVAMLIMFVMSMAIFIARNKQTFEMDDTAACVLAFFIAVVCSVFWVVSVPIIVIITAAWYAAKWFSNKS